jgi:hypothetical protein
MVERQPIVTLRRIGRTDLRVSPIGLGAKPERGPHEQRHRTGTGHRRHQVDLYQIHMGFGRFSPGVLGDRDQAAASSTAGRSAGTSLHEGTMTVEAARNWTRSDRARRRPDPALNEILPLWSVRM